MVIRQSLDWLRVVVATKHLCKTFLYEAPRERTQKAE